MYFGVVVGRVANRIQNGILQIRAPNSKDQTIQLEQNNYPNHLHGGSGGFHQYIWDAECVSTSSQTEDVADAVQFSMLSPDGDQSYPGSVQVTATYSLHKTATGASLRLSLEADLVSSDSGKSTPMNLAQHSYFNLAGHDDPAGILDHTLTLNSDFYTPVNDTCIPTRQVVHVNDDPAMDWRKPRLLRHALKDFATSHAALTATEADDALQMSRVAPDIAVDGRSGKPFGFDHNYIIRTTSSTTTDNTTKDDDNKKLRLVAILEHPHTRRRMTVRSDAPGVQLYTANDLDGVSLPTSATKDAAVYRQWQALCLETQHFPDSVLVDEQKHVEFAKGKCVIISTNNPTYEHSIEYEFSLGSFADFKFRGIDTAGNQYASVDEMWKANGVLDGETAENSWYNKAAAYYEENCPSTLDGVLGGYASISDTDLEGKNAIQSRMLTVTTEISVSRVHFAPNAGSRLFIQRLQSLIPKLDWSTGAACECGAGIGRVTKGLLLNLSVTQCDLVEPNARLLSAAPDYIGDKSSNCKFYCSRLHEWVPRSATYSIIWIQWVFCYLTDDDAVAFLERCAKALIDGGIICLKENTCVDHDFVVDMDDASICRSTAYIKVLTDRAGLEIVQEELQRTFPVEIYPVPMLALIPKKKCA
jgi:galactose mutarotase-like enzyme